MRTASIDYRILKPFIESGLTDRQVAAKVGCSPYSVFNYRTNVLHFKRQPKIDYSVVDKLLAEGLTPKEIVARGACSRSTLSFYIRARRGEEDKDSIPLIPPADRLTLALKVKARRVNMPVAWMWGVWLKANPEFLRNYEVRA